MTANVGGKYDHKPTFLYRASSSDGRLLYVGITHDPDQRLKSHRYKAEWFPEAARMEWRCYPNRRAALDAERVAIDFEHPLHNVTWEEIVSRRKENRRRLDAWRKERRAQRRLAHERGEDCGGYECDVCEPIRSAVSA